MENVWSIPQPGTIEIHTQYYLGSLNITISNTTDTICFTYYNSTVHNQPFSVIQIHKYTNMKEHRLLSQLLMEQYQRQEMLVKSILAAKQNGQVDMFAVFLKLIDQACK